MFSPLVLVQTNAQTEEEKIKRSEELQKQIQELSQKLNDTRNKKASLTNEIVYMDTQITIAQLKVQQTSARVTEMTEEIKNLAEKIITLEGSLDTISEVFIDRVIATYKTGKIPTFLLLTNGNGTSDLVSRTAYLKRIQEHDKKLMYEVQATKTDFQDQKVLLEDKKVELNTLKATLQQQQIVLDEQKKNKESVLELTKNDERKYQELLASAKAELEAIQAIVAGEGTETDSGSVNEGDQIASVIQGPSCNSSGAHLHFIVRGSGDSVQNPFSYLSGIGHENCSGSSCGSGDADPFNPSGDWRWPIESTIRFVQGYGSTWAVHNTWVGRIYSFHNGIDIVSTSSFTVYAVKSGTLYRGSYSGSNGCALRYVRVDHKDSDLDSLYLHVNY
jgi:peptidoglycan hydrolase CwlO-like protein